MTLSIKQLEEIINAAPNKELPVHYLGDGGDLKFEVAEARLEDKVLLLIEGEELPTEDEDEEEEEEDDDK